MQIVKMKLKEDEGRFVKSHLNSYANTISRDISNNEIKCLTKKLSPRIIGFRYTKIHQTKMLITCQRR